MSDGQQEMGKAPEAPTMDSAMQRMAMQRMRDQQNLSAGVVAGLVAAVVGGVLWAAVTVLTGYQIGWMAIGVGFLVGYAIRAVGRGVDPIFGIAGAALSFVGCVIGNLLTVCYFVSENEGVAILELLPQLNLEMVIQMMVATFSPMDLLFYGIAVYEGFRLSTRQISEAELQTATTGPVIG